MAKRKRYRWRKGHRCPCCGYYTLSRRGHYDICPVCFWEDADPLETFGQSALDRGLGPNGMYLSQARANYLVFGATSESAKPFVRLPRDSEMTLPSHNPAGT